MLASDITNNALDMALPAGDSTTPIITQFLPHIQFYKKVALGDFVFIIFDHQKAAVILSSEYVPKWLSLQTFKTPWAFENNTICEKHQAFRVKAQQRSENFYAGLLAKEMLQFKACLTFSIENDLGKNMHIAQQIIPLTLDLSGKIASTLMTFTDISHLKNNDSNSLSFMALNDGKHLLRVVQKELCEQNQIHLSKREQQILRLLVSNHDTKNIAAELHISIFTVKNHRKHLLQKSGCHSTAEMIRKCAEYSWLD